MNRRCGRDDATIRKSLCSSALWFEWLRCENCPMILDRIICLNALQRNKNDEKFETNTVSPSNKYAFQKDSHVPFLVTRFFPAHLLLIEKPLFPRTHFQSPLFRVVCNSTYTHNFEKKNYLIFVSLACGLRLIICSGESHTILVKLFHT